MTIPIPQLTHILDDDFGWLCSNYNINRRSNAASALLEVLISAVITSAAALRNPSI